MSAAASAAASQHGGIDSSVTDNLSKQYTAQADDGCVDPKAREAAMLFSVAENHLNNNEDCEECIQAASDALALFREVGDRSGESDALRLIIHGYKAKADAVRYTSESADEGSAAVTEILKEAKNRILKELEECPQNDRYKRGALLLSQAELHMDEKGSENVEAALVPAVEARAIFRDMQEVRLKGTACYLLADIYAKRREIRDATACATEALEVFSRLGDKKKEAKCSYMLASVYMMDDMFQSAMQAAMRALKIFRELENQKMVAFLCYNMATWYQKKDKFRDSLPLAREAHMLFKEMNYGKGWQASSLAALAQAQVHGGDPQQGKKLIEEGLKGFEEAGDKRGQIMVLEALVQAHLKSEDQEDALAAAERGLKLCRDLGDRRWEAELLRAIAAVHAQAQDWEEAEKAGQEAQALAQGFGDKKDEADVCADLVRLNLAKKDHEAALGQAAAQHELYKQTGDRAREADALLLIAGARAMQGEVQDALADVKDALDMFRELEDRTGEATACMMLAEVQLAKDACREAYDAAAEARDILKARNNHAMTAQAFALIAKIRTQEDERPQDAVKAAAEAVAFSRKAEDERLQVEMLNQFSQALVNATIKEANEAKAEDVNPIMFKGVSRAFKPAQDGLRLAKQLQDQSLVASMHHQLGAVQMVAGKFREAIKSAELAMDLFRTLGDRAGEVGCMILVAEVYVHSGETEKAEQQVGMCIKAAEACDDAEMLHRAAQVVERIKQEKQGGQVVQVQQVAAPEGTPAAPAAAAQAPAEQKGLDPKEVEKLVNASIIAATGEDDLSMDAPLMDSGLDSLSSVSFRNDLQRAIGFKLPSALIFDYPTARLIVEHIVETSRE
eukprot:TRINITY_DN41642_c0_g1_i2.p1 TRINITY_DN41642_c0_g1~~TRINITY_DN41642_c0_g1_i2.p1  ORF type:complete len:850 (+),score=303.49 TRINITY_DN41642_c0_g1_i2:141-2690(+)